MHLLACMQAAACEPDHAVPHRCNIGDEAFLGPELLFSPAAFTQEWTASLPQVVDSVIQSCPIDARKPLYSNIVLSVSGQLASMTCCTCHDKHLCRRLVLWIIWNGSAGPALYCKRTC